MEQSAPHPERPLTVAEEIANSVTHGLGLVASLVGMPVLVIAAAGRADALHVVGCSVFAASLIALYAASTIYHALPPSRAKQVFRVIDHVAIYLLIAGTYTPFTLGILRGALGWTLFGLVWSFAAVGIVFKTVLGLRYPRGSTVFYLLMGWLAVIAVRPITAQVPAAGLAWLVAGGLLYTGGVAFFVWERQRHSHAVWHVCVLGGSVCHFFAVLWYAAPIFPLNPYTVIVVAALLLDHAARVVASLLNLRALDPLPPAEFRDVYDAGRYQRAQAYLRARTRFGILAASLQLLAVLGFWLAGGFGWLDRTVRELGGGPVVTGLLFVGALGLARTLLGVPFAVWSTFGIEARFGFNRTSLPTFVADRIKGLALAIVLGGPLLAAVLWLFETAGPTAWLWGWAMSAVAIVAIQFVVPAWIMPLFSRFTPLAPGTLRDAILAYARTVDFPLADVYVVDGSRRSTKANAFFTGLGRQRRIALYDTLLTALDPGAIVAVVAHEVGHWKRGHVPRGIALGVLHLGGMFFLLSLVLGRPALFAAFGIAQPSPWAALVLLTLLLAPVELVTSIVLHAWSRRNEREADRFAVETTADGPALARGLKRLSADSLANLTPHPLTVWLDYSHPPVLERVRALDPASGHPPAAADRHASSRPG